MLFLVLIIALGLFISGCAETTGGGDNGNDQNKSIRLENQILLDFDTYFEWPNLESNHFSNGFCYGLSSHMGILSNGTVIPCCLDGFGVIHLGNIFHQSLQDILKNEKTSNIINNFKNNIAVESLCQKCTFKDRFNKPLT